MHLECTRLVEADCAPRMMDSEGGAKLSMSRPSSADLADGELSSPERPSLLMRASVGHAFTGEWQAREAHITCSFEGCTTREGGGVKCSFAEEQLGMILYTCPQDSREDVSVVHLGEFPFRSA